MNFTPFPDLSSERIELRRLSSEDTDDLCKLRSDESVNEFLDRPKTLTSDDALKFINKIDGNIENNEGLYWVINLRNDPQLIGTICLWNFNTELCRGEIGFELMPEFQGKGIMKEAVSLVLKYSFETIGMKMIDGFTHLNNVKSQKLLEKFNFKRNPELEKEISEKEKGFDLMIYTLET